MVDDKGVVTPLLRLMRLMRKTTEVMLRIQSEFGFTPVGRSRLGMPAGGLGDDPEPANPNERFDTILPDGNVLPYAGGDKGWTRQALASITNPQQLYGIGEFI